MDKSITYVGTEEDGSDVILCRPFSKDSTLVKLKV